MAWELFVPPGTEPDESMASFVIRRLGREAYDRLIQPLVGGIYTADPERLSLKATMPRFLEMERTHGSLIRATMLGRSTRGKSANGPDGKAGSGARYSLFVGLQGGMSSLVEALASRLPPDSLRSRTRVRHLERLPHDRWLVRCEGGPSEQLDADAVILATPVQAAARLIEGVEPELAGRLGSIRSTSSAVVSLGYRRDQVTHPLDGFGFVVPTIERRAILSGSFSSVKFPGRGPAGTALFRVFMGGAGRPEILDLPDEELFALASRELADLLGIRGEPCVRHLDRWPQVMPQYEVGHVERVAEIEAMAARVHGLELAGNAYHGVGVPYCIHSGEQAAERAVAALNA
jgi:oxygen-dependent protoporphyrinogen oxidase